MPVIKFRSIEEMNRTPLPVAPGSDQKLLQRIDRLWRRAMKLRPRRPWPRGVFRFCSIEEAQAARERRSG